MFQNNEANIYEKSFVSLLLPTSDKQLHVIIVSYVGNNELLNSE